MSHAESTESTKKKDQLWYRRELQSNECLCGREKRPNHSFCYPCYTALPGDMREALYHRIGGGYEEAFEEAHTWLEETIW